MRSWFDELGVFDEWRNKKMHIILCSDAQFFVHKWVKVRGRGKDRYQKSEARKQELENRK